MQQQTQSLTKLKEKLLATLLIYEKRGHDAVLALVESGDESFVAALKRRDRVFYNLAALERLAQHKGFDMTTDSVARAAWERIEKLNLRLAELLEQAKIRLRNQLSSVSQAETQVRFYHSYNEPPLRLFKLA